MSFENTNLVHLTHQYGTPLYIYSEQKIEEQFRSLKDALKPLRHLICYAVKANSNLSIIGYLNQLGSGFDIVSEGELRRVLAGGGSSDKVVFAGVAKTESEIEFALAQGIKFFNVESASELKLIDAVAARMNCVAPVSFRINPDIKVETHPYLATGLKTSKFGVTIPEAFELWEYIKSSRNLNLKAVDCHIGSQITDLVPLREAYTQVIRVAKELEERGAKIENLDFGGGLGVGYSGHYAPLDIPAFGKMVNELCAGLNYEIIFEPGKFLIAEAGTLLTKVLFTKENEENKFVIVDAGMNDLIRPSLYEAFHQIDVVNKDGRIREVGEKDSDLSGEVDIVGPVCETGCYFARKRKMPVLKEGDLVAIRDAGAYCFSMASNYNTRLLPAEIMVSASGKTRQIRRRDSYEKLWENEVF